MNSPSNVTCVIVCFNANIALEKIVSLMLEQVTDIIIVDNNSKSATKIMLKEIARLYQGRVSVIFNEENCCFGKGMNIGIKSAIARGSKYILQLNDDSYLSKNAVKNMLDCFQDCAAKPLGIVAPADRQPLDGMWSEGLVNELKDDALIPSAGMLIPSEVFERVGLYDEDLVIGYEDYDLSLRVIDLGYRSVVLSNTCLYANLGSSESRNFLWKRITVCNYSPLRRYYAARNGLFLLKRWRKNRDPLRSVLYWERNTIFGIIFFEKNKLKKIYYTLLGYVHALRGIMGQKC